MNRELLIKVRDAIEAEPMAFKMSMWISKDIISPCGTTACIAGWAATLSDGFVNPWDALDAKLRADQSTHSFFCH